MCKFANKLTPYSFVEIALFCLFSIKRTTFSEFAGKHARDSRFKAIEKMKDRETIFVEFMTALRKREKEDTKNRAEKVGTSDRNTPYFHLHLHHYLFLSLRFRPVQTSFPPLTIFLLCSAILLYSTALFCLIDDDYSAVV